MTPDEALEISERFSKATKPEDRTANDQVRDVLAAEVRSLRGLVDEVIKQKLIGDQAIDCLYYVLDRLSDVPEGAVLSADEACTAIDNFLADIKLNSLAEKVRKA